MVLDWVYGCRGCDVNKNLWILKSGELVYFVSTTVVIYNRVKETQRHYRGHTEEITCMDINPSKNLGLSGQRNGKTHDSRFVLYSRIPKGKLISKCPFGVIIWMKMATKKFDNFCPRILKVVKS